MSTERWKNILAVHEAFDNLDPEDQELLFKEIKFEFECLQMAQKFMGKRENDALTLAAEQGSRGFVIHE